MTPISSPQAIETILPNFFTNPFAAFLVSLLAFILVAVWLRKRFQRETGLFKEALNKMDRGIAIIDSRLRIYFINEWFERKIDFPGSLLNRPLIGIPPFSNEHSLIKTLSGLTEPAARDFPIVFRSEIELGNPRKKVLVLAGLNRFHPEPAGDAMYVLSITEIAETEALRERLKQTEKEATSNVKKLTELDKLKSEFLAICSHELRTPLVSITGYLDLLLAEKLGPISQKQKDALQVSIKNSLRLNGIISSLLDFAKMEGGRLRFEFTPQRLSSLVKEVIEVLLPMTDAKEIRIISRLGDDLPLVYMDATLIHRVLLNLLDNAIKFCPFRGEIEIRATPEKNIVHIEISDTGSGITPEKIDKVKEPFFQADASDKRKTGGLGLGLAIVEKILIGHSSKLGIVSIPEKGTTVSFDLKQAKKTNSGKYASYKAGSN